METIAIPVYVVRRYDPDGIEILSAWKDEFEARYEACRWEQDGKVKHDYVAGSLVVPVEGVPNAD